MEKKLRLRVYTDEEIEKINSKFKEWEESDFEIADNFLDMVNEEDKKKKKILEIIREKKNITSQEIVELTKFNISTVDWFIDELKKDGIIQSKTHFQLI